MKGKYRPTEISFYEGLIHKTAGMYSPHIQDDYEDIVSILRIKVWRALEAYDPTRSRQPIERYVFSCVRNQVKDLLKRRVRHEVYMADPEPLLPSVPADVVYAEVEDEHLSIPSTLTELEREVVLRLYVGETLQEAARWLGVPRPEVTRALARVREKMADWRPPAPPLEQVAA